MSDSSYERSIRCGILVEKPKNKIQSKSIKDTEDIKIGKIVLKSLKELLDGKDIPKDILENLQDKYYCKEEINVNYPLLIKIDPYMPFISQVSVNGRTRYWSKDTIFINGDEYAMCSQWYYWNASSFKNWLLQMKNILNED